MDQLDDDLINELKGEFVAEVLSMIDECEESFLHLEAPDNRDEHLQKIFRLAHSVKGSSNAFGFTDLGDFAHLVEDCLTILRADSTLVTSEIVSLLLQANDAIRLKVQMIEVESEEVWDVSELSKEVEELRVYLHQKASEFPPMQPTEKSASSHPQELIDVDAIQAQMEAEAHGEAPAEPDTVDNVVELETAKSIKSQPTKKVKRSETIKVDSGKIDNVLNLVGELVVLESQLEHAQQRGLGARAFGEIMDSLKRTVRELQDESLSIRMTSVKPLFLRLNRVVRDLSVNLDKPLECELIGEDTELDRQLIELVSDPLVHIVRNSVDHGIEPKALRSGSEKPEKAHVSIEARQTGGRVEIEVRDDGRGIDKQKIFTKALEKGLLPQGTQLESLAEEEIYALMMRPGFSTAEKVTDVSGRGVGLDVVKSNIEQIRGEIKIKSTLGKGTSFICSLPLTTAISDGMVVRSQNVSYIVPTHSVEEITNFSEAECYQASSSREMIRLRDQIYPLFRIGHFTKANGEASKPEKDNVILLLKKGTDSFGLLVDSILGQSQFVIRSLGEGLERPDGVAGAAVMGDGSVALVIDIEGIWRTLTNERPEMAA